MCAETHLDYENYTGEKSPAVGIEETEDLPAGDPQQLRSLIDGDVPCCMDKRVGNRDWVA